METERGKELSELYAIFQRSSKHPELLDNPEKIRVMNLLKEHTCYQSLKPLARTPFILALSYGAKIDENGLLIVDSPECRKLIMQDVRMKKLPKASISPQTPNYGTLKVFESRAKVTHGDWATKGLTPRAERGRLGRWPRRGPRG